MPNLKTSGNFEAYMHLIIKNRMVLCRGSHRSTIMSNEIIQPMICSFLEMIQAGMEGQATLRGYF